MAGDYHRGEMDIQEQAATYAAFGGMAKWGSLAIAVVLTVITLWFCTPAGFLGGLIPGIVLAVLGVVFLREKPGSTH
ncbi:MULTISPECIES: aa3-type cytochrome c oxidase subunit IV [unclassified Caulobacter]|uniref:aa3-type cytochrome c oxidase subunit IV n=1 Tax=unclassified Caulobacter TaxID=2648921 RepID=UPI000D39B911|nr:MULTISPECIES: aa3-type cytochrome c oxidase subunit IV [unclassified Caulobacter]PTS88499.1 aa3-type cytochrome c oxidase subunit IV [Caulobacter sp. HMWF009]PTT09730.1 aa3-type cytochrome c oxidase subunit IV [Caulobacter sp. HMWF025]PTT77294.1 aa3-type cytochrome c oxidase subunit IV [Pseudomonas sp. HMWF010]